MKVIDIYNEAVIMMIDEFRIKYYTFDDGSKADYDCNTESSVGPGPIIIGEDYRSIDDIWVALKHNVDKKTLFRWHEYAHNEYISERRPVNLYNYNLGLRPNKEDEEK